MNAGRLVVVLTKVPEPGRVKTRLGKVIGMSAAAGLARALLVDVLRGAAAAIGPGDGLRVVHDPDPPPLWFAELVAGAAPRATLVSQTAGDLGQRLAAALDHPGPRLALGSDLPDLPPATLAAGFAALEQAPLVLGPAEDGGYYLLGLGAGVPATPLTSGIRWSSAETRADTVAAFAAAGLGPAAALEARRDVDDLPALRDLAQRLQAQPAAAPATWAWLSEHAALWRDAAAGGPTQSGPPSSCPS